MVSATDTDVKRLVWSALAAPVRPQTYKNLLYVSLAFPLGLAYFVFVSVTVPLSIALLILVVGLPLLILTVGIALGLAGLERRLTRVLLDVDVPGVRELDGDSRRERLFGLVTDRPTLTTLVYLPSKLFVGLASAIVVVTTFSTGVAMLFVPLYYTEPGLYVGVVSNRPVELHPALYVGWNNLLVGFETVVEIGVWEVSTLGGALVVAVLGVGVCLFGVNLLNAVAWLNGRFARLMLADGFDPVSALRER